MRKEVEEDLLAVYIDGIFKRGELAVLDASHL